jgi:hypothetical protein
LQLQDQASHAVCLSPEPGCLRDQQYSSPDDNGSDGSRDTLTGCAWGSTVTAAATNAIARRFITPMAKRIAVRFKQL